MRIRSVSTLILHHSVVILEPHAHSRRSPNHHREAKSNPDPHKHLKLMGASPHPPPRNTEASTLERHSTAAHCFTKTCCAVMAQRIESHHRDHHRTTNVDPKPTTTTSPQHLPTHPRTSHHYPTGHAYPRPPSPPKKTLQAKFDLKKHHL